MHSARNEYRFRASCKGLRSARLLRSRSPNQGKPDHPRSEHSRRGSQAKVFSLAIERAGVYAEDSRGFFTAIPGARFSPSKHACFDLPFRKLIAHNAFPNSLSYRLGRWSGSQWLLLSVKHERPSLLMPCSALSAPISVLFPIRGRARLKSPWTTP